MDDRMYFKVNFFVIGVWCLVGVKGIVIIFKRIYCSFENSYFDKSKN